MCVQRSTVIFIKETEVIRDQYEVNLEYVR